VTASWTELEPTYASLKPGESCTVTAQYAFTAAGQTDTATLAATGKKAGASASVTLTGASTSGQPNLTIGSPAVFTGTSGTTNNYSYSFGVFPPQTLTQQFTVTNVSGSPAQISYVVPYGASGEFGYPSVTAGTCTGATLETGQSCDFTILVSAFTCEGHPPGLIDNTIGYRVENADQTLAYDDLQVTWQWVCP
jgi:hypothetical protein